ncbi:MAG: hypothetical protein FGM15_11825 [Chthoniobacterales bacterium]|nr:hypothetical protein [Chthoniobacterales bacterium]
MERVDLSERGEKGAAALVRRNVFSWQDGGLDNWNTPAAAKFGETPVLKYECAMLDGGSNVGLSAAIVLIRQNGTATTLASETVMPDFDFSEMTLRAAGPVTEDGCSVVVAFRPWNVAQECAGVGGFLIRNVRLEMSKEN